MDSPDGIRRLVSQVTLCSNNGDPGQAVILGIRKLNDPIHCYSHRVMRNERNWAGVRQWGRGLGPCWVCASLSPSLLQRWAERCPRKICGMETRMTISETCAFVLPIACEGREVQERQIEAKGAEGISEGIWELELRSCAKKPENHHLSSKCC